MAERRRVEAPVERVELFQDRATVFRRIAFDAPGRHVLAVGPLSPLVRERGLAFVGDGVLVEDVRVERSRVRIAEGDSEQAARLQEALDALGHQARRARAELSRAEEQVTRARAARDTARGWTPRALAERPDTAAWIGALRTLEEAVVDAEVRLAELRGRADRLQTEAGGLERRLEEARRGTRLLQATLELQVLVERPGTLLVKYTVPCALWRPSHVAELDGDRIRWQIAATAWNGTGEDWQGVQLVCSTARPGEHAVPPELEDDVIRTRRREKEVVIEARDEAIAEARVDGAHPTRAAGVGVDDGGEARTFTAPAPVDLPSTGRPVRVALERWEDTARTVWLGHPERASEVVLRSTQRNAGARPLLAGPVDLVRDGIAVGRTEIGLVPSGEPFHVGWGSHDGLRVVRRRDHERERGRISGRQTHRFEVELKVTHTGDAPVRFQLVERVPVSEVREVTVGRPTAEPALTEGPDADGFCTWTLSLAPGEVAKLRLGYVLEAPSNVRLPF